MRGRAGVREVRATRGGIRTSWGILGDEAVEDLGGGAAAVLGDFAGGDGLVDGGAGGGVEQKVGEGVLPAVGELFDGGEGA